jgi:hypothetical protein
MSLEMSKSSDVPEPLLKTHTTQQYPSWQGRRLALLAERRHGRPRGPGSPLTTGAGDGFARPPMDVSTQGLDSEAS